MRREARVCHGRGAATRTQYLLALVLEHFLLLGEQLLPLHVELLRQRISDAFQICPAAPGALSSTARPI